MLRPKKSGALDVVSWPCRHTKLVALLVNTDIETSLTLGRRELKPYCAYAPLFIKAEVSKERRVYDIHPGGILTTAAALPETPNVWHRPVLFSNKNALQPSCATLRHPRAQSFSTKLLWSLNKARPVSCAVDCGPKLAARTEGSGIHCRTSFTTLL